MRKLPVYLLLDTSASMQGEPIESMKKGIDSMISSLLRNPQAIESVYISVITFNSIAEVKIPLIELVSFQLMNLVAMGQTALGAGLKLLADRINSEVIKTTPERKGDWKPIVFIITDGAPIDDWQKGLDYFSSCKTAFTVACAVGSHVDTTVLKKITNDVINLEKTDGDSMSRFFLWLSSSINVSSNQVEKDGAGRTLFDLDKLPPPPPEINIIK